ncbi:MAG: PRC-barrel domain containing protein [Gammaproteobacteria bacterium]|nr:PRC-barrel domain containing protein [Gammaproteobacteria bacterium]
MKRTVLLILLVLAVPAANASVNKASDWLGHAVVTRDGEALGTVRDIAIDQRTGRVLYLAVSWVAF